ncbi:TetR/AcrR family transcriptional regulator [Tumebacillus permanentifrigoris]|uniref:TetR family transcriptional regulator n=1 Tax=Tumebacillus permanentifrigoris TaxID=378543 RepID=A0A316DBJ7_9BACL|nr:TetR/AcrR family transcriptional regulator [Tumebacillus permanentifrigoris]PWK14975.1 TetR family transcriptional regulator [Tumebacillus permanentifrigoris]
MATSRQELRAEETKRAILGAASELFAERGFDTVTMREIAKVAGCSHTTIYLYFKDKEALLHQLSMAPLQALHAQMEAILGDQAMTPEERLKFLSRIFLHFCLSQKTMYTVFFMTQTSRVDESEPTLEIQKLRNQLFGLLQQAIAGCLPVGLDDAQFLAYARIYFFTLQGIIGTYTVSEEPYERVLERLTPTFDLAMEVLLAGCRETAKTRGV